MTKTINLLKTKNTHFPARFQFDDGGPVIDVDAVERCWTETKDPFGGATFRFLVRCGAQRYMLSEDSASGKWTVILPS